LQVSPLWSGTGLVAFAIRAGRLDKLRTHCNVALGNPFGIGAAAQCGQAVLRRRITRLVSR